MRHPGVPEHLRGTYLGLASDPIIDHLVGLGVTAVELMPTHQFVADRHLVERGLTNYWGYNSIAFLAPHVGYATGGLGEQVGEFKSMVRTLHRAGLEVILDVVYNHTGEGNHLGPTLSLRGIDNAVYYRLNPEDPRYHVDFTGTGNSLNIVHPRTMALIMDSLRYWVTDMHVDGFRFDLAPVLVRGYEAGQPSAFFEIIQQDPVLSKVKLIAEPWDVGPDGYQLGRFPPGWSEWNGAFRDAVRRFWRGDPGQVPELASRLTGSSDIYAPSGRRTYAIVNFVTCHDGFTLTDLVSYEQRHNEANGEDNQDGARDNLSRNWGVEGPSPLGADRAGPGPDEAQLPHHPHVLPGRAHDPRRRRDRADPEGQQQRLLPGLRGQLGRLGRGRDRHRPLRLHPGPDHHRGGQPHLAPARLLHRRAHRRPGPGRDLGPPRRRDDDRRRLEGPREPLDRHAAPRAGRRRGRHPRAGWSRATRCSCC